jgi:hypothetical protein
MARRIVRLSLANGNSDSEAAAFAAAEALEPSLHYS